MYIYKAHFLFKQGSFWERVLRTRTNAKTPARPEKLVT